MKHLLFFLFIFFATHTVAQDIDTTQAKSLLQLSSQLIDKGEYKQALNNALQAKTIAEKFNNKIIIADAYNLAGLVYWDTGNFPEALKNYFTALRMSESVGNKKGIASALGNIGTIYDEQGDYNEALKNYTTALKIITELGDKKNLALAYINIDIVKDEQGKTTEALANYNEALKLQEEVNDKNGILISYNNIGVVYEEENNYSEALKNYTSALKIAKEINDKGNISNSYTNIGKLFSKQNKTKEAIDYFNKGLELAIKIGSIDDMKENYNALAEANITQGNYKEALNNYKNFVTMRDSLYNEESTKKTVQEKMQYDFDKKETATKAEQNIKDAVAEQKNRIVILSVTLGSGIVFVVMLLFFNRRKAKHNLKVNQLENKTLRSQLNPHFIFNALASIQEYMHEHPELAEDYLAKFGRLMREVLENSEKDYISLADEFEMLKKYMDLETLRVEAGFDYEFVINKNTDDETIQVPPLLLQPIIENAIWHGVAKGTTKGKITIKVTKENEMLKVEVENTNNEPLLFLNKEKEKKKSFGLQIVKERLALLSKEKKRKGSLNLAPIENGMKVILEIPV